MTYIDSWTIKVSMVTYCIQSAYNTSILFKFRCMTVIHIKLMF